MATRAGRVRRRTRAGVLAFWSFLSAASVLVGCPGEFRGLGPDPPDAGGTTDGASCSRCAPIDSGAPTPDAAGDAATPDANPPSGDASGDDDGSLAPDAPGLRDSSAADVAADAPSAEAGCGPLDSVHNCGGCGNTCDTTTGTASCDGITCSYACNVGRSDCNGGGAPDTDGCECATPACCGGACQTTHDNGVGGTYYDCVAPATYAQAQGFGACAAYAGGKASCTEMKCDDGQGGTYNAVCGADATLQNCACWAYDGAGAGHVYESSICDCPLVTDPKWN